MADDVKVKFGGDFTDVPKGAEAAANAAGSKLKSYFSEGLQSIAASIGSAFAFTALFDKFKEGMSGAKEYFNELNRAIRTTGAGGDEFQRVAFLGKSVGVTMESVGRAMGFFAKNMGAASKDAKGHGKILKELGFTTDEITSGNISATDVLVALSKQFESTGNEALLAANATALFGRGGRELLPIVMKGSDAIAEQAKSLKIYSEAELQAAEAAERANERRTASWKKFFKFLELSIDEADTKSIVLDTMNEKAQEMLEKGKKPAGADIKEYNTELFKELKSKGVGYAAQESAFIRLRNEQMNMPGITGSVRSAIESQFNNLIGALQTYAKENPSKETKAPTATGVSALAASSLQQIGGGDITSVMSGLANGDVASNIARTADATERMANKEAPKPGPQTLR